METPDRLPTLAPDPPVSDEQLEHFGREAIADVKWSIVDLRSADWAMRKVAEAHADIGKAELAAASWHQEINDWLKRVTASAQSTIAFLGHHLERYALDQRAKSGDRDKTVYLPGGEVRTAEYGPRIVVSDEAKLIEWCEANDLDDRVKVTKSIGVNDLRGLLAIADGVVVVAETGEVVPGVDIKPGHTTTKVVPR